MAQGSRAARVLVTSFSASALLIGGSPAVANTVVVNPAGGNTAGDGLRIAYSGAQLQVYRDGRGQLYDPGRKVPDGWIFNHLSLSVGSPGEPITVFTASPMVQHSRLKGTGKTVFLPWEATTTETDSGFVSVLTGRVEGRTYTVNLEATYAVPRDYFELDYTVDVPEGNTEPVRLYHLFDTFLSGSDTGPGFYQEPTCAGPMVGVDRSDLGVVEALQYMSGRKWSSYASQWYKISVFGETGNGPGWANELSNRIDTNPRTDNGMGTAWNFGREPGTKRSTSRLTFSNAIPTDCPTQTSFDNPPETFIVGRAFPVTAKVTGYEGHLPTGTVEIIDGDTVLCTAEVGPDGRATCDITMTSESATIEARFRGTQNNADSVGQPHSLVAVDAVPDITKIFPAKGPISGGQTITIHGENFAEDAEVFIGKKRCTDVQVIDDSTIICITPKQPAGRVDVTVKNPDGKSATAEDAYKYEPVEDNTDNNGGNDNKGDDKNDGKGNDNNGKDNDGDNNGDKGKDDNDGDNVQPVQKYLNTLNTGKVKKTASGRTVDLRGTTKGKATRVYIYRANTERSPAELVKVVSSDQHVWKSANTPLGNRKSALFCARFNSPTGPWAATIRVPSAGPKAGSKSGIAGEVRSCPVSR